MNFLAGPDAREHDRNGAPIDEHLCQIDDACGRHFRHIGLAGQRAAHGCKHRVDGAVAAEQKAGHVFGRERDRPTARDLVEEERHDGAA